MAGPNIMTIKHHVCRNYTIKPNKPRRAKDKRETQCVDAQIFTQHLSSQLSSISYTHTILTDREDCSSRSCCCDLIYTHREAHTHRHACSTHTHTHTHTQRKEKLQIQPQTFLHRPSDPLIVFTLTTHEVGPGDILAPNGFDIVAPQSNDLICKNVTDMDKQSLDRGDYLDVTRNIRKESRSHPTGTIQIESN